MRRKQINKILLPLVIIIWAIVALRYFFHWEKSDNLLTKDDSTFFTANISSIDSFGLLANYRDPFLDTEQIQKPARKAVNSDIPSRLIVTPKATKTPFVMPEIRYLGNVHGADSMHATGLIQLNGYPIQIQEGDSIEGIYVLEIRKNYISVNVQDSIILIRY